MVQTVRIPVTNSDYTALTAAGQGITFTIDSTIGGGQLVIATSAPAANTENYFTIRNTDFPVEIGTVGGSDIVYFKADRANTVVRAIK